MTGYVLAIDQGTTSSRAILFDEDISISSLAQQEFEQHFPRSGWVEHDPEEIWQTTLDSCLEAIEKAGIQASEITALGITNQRETTLIWDRETGKPLHRAIVWQDRRTSSHCAELRKAGHEQLFRQKTGLLLDPYFSGTKISWLLDNVAGARDSAEKGRLAFGTIDSFLLWRLTDGRVHATDATNASRTLLYDIHDGSWSEELCELLRVPMSLLPEVRDSAAEYGVSAKALLGAEIPICGIAGDQQAATVGQACFKPGMMKSTYGTGCFAMLNTGAEPVTSSNKMLTTIAYQLDGKPVYALEGSIFVAGAAVQWLRDGLGVIDHANETDALAGQADPEQHVYLVPAFVGMGAPYWDSEARGAVFGLTRGSSPKELARAALESVCYQTRDLIEAMHADCNLDGETILRVDGGMVASDWTMQCLSDTLNSPVDRPRVLETTALGAAYLAGMKSGLYPGMDEFARGWALERRFEPVISDEERIRKYAGWRDAVRRTLTAPEEP